PTPRRRAPLTHPFHPRRLTRAETCIGSGITSSELLSSAPARLAYVQPRPPWHGGERPRARPRPHRARWPRDLVAAARPATGARLFRPYDADLPPPCATPYAAQFVRAGHPVLESACGHLGPSWRGDGRRPRWAW